MILCSLQLSGGVDWCTTIRGKNSNIEGMVILPLSLSDCALWGEPNIVPSSIDGSGGMRYPICQEAGEARDVFSANRRDFLLPFVADHLI